MLLHFLPIDSANNKKKPADVISMNITAGTLKLRTIVASTSLVADVVSRTAVKVPQRTDNWGFYASN